MPFIRGTVRSICCECGRCYATSDDPDVNGTVESHGYCDSCYEKAMNED